MMKKMAILLFIFTSAVSYATTITINNKRLECVENNGPANYYNCSSNGRDILVVNAGFGYSAYSKDSNGKLTLTNVTKVEEGNKTLYETPAELLAMGGMNGGIKPNNNNSDTVTNRKLLATAVINSLSSIDDPIAKNLVSDAKKYISEIKKPTKIKLSIKDHGDYQCNAGTTRALTEIEKSRDDQYSSKTQCDYYACKDKAGNDALAYVPDNGSLISPLIVTLHPKGKENLHFNGIKISSIDKKKTETIFDIPAVNLPEQGSGSGMLGSFGNPQTPASDDQIEMTDYLPTKIKERMALYSFISQPGNAETINYLGGLCNDEKISSLIKRQNEVADELNNSIIEANLSHLISVTNGKIIGTLMPTDNIRKYGCLYNGMYISPKAVAHLNYLKRLNEKPNQANYLSLNEAQDLFKKAAAMEDIPFGYKYDGCYARAHVMARRFEAMGIPTEKVWIKGDLSVPGTDIRWNFHVAPVITVKDPVDGTPKKYVIDPSLEDKAVPLDEWVATMKANVRGPIIKTSYPIPVNAAMMERTAVALSSSDPYLPNDTESLSEEDKMKYARETMIEYSRYVRK